MKALHKCLLVTVVPATMILILYSPVFKRSYSFNFTTLRNMTYIFNTSSFFMEIERNLSSKLREPQNSSKHFETIGAQNDNSERQIIDKVLALKTKKSTDFTCRRLFTTSLLEERLTELRRTGHRGGDGVSEDAALHLLMGRLKRFVRDTRGPKEKNKDRPSKERTRKKSYQYKFKSVEEKPERYFQSPVGDLKKIKSPQNINSLNKPLQKERFSRKHSHQLKPTNTSVEPRSRRHVDMQIEEITSNDSKFDIEDTGVGGYGQGMLFMEPYYELAMDVPSALYPNLTTVTQTRLEQVSGRYPWLPCRLYQYSFREARLCAARLKLQQQMPLRMTFFGDSRARMLMGDTFKALNDEAWRMYFTPRHDTESVAVVDVKLIRDIVDHMNQDKNMTWVDRLMRAEFNVTETDMDASSWAGSMTGNYADDGQTLLPSVDVGVNPIDGGPSVMEESSNPDSVMRSFSDFNENRNGCCEYFPIKQQLRESGNVQTSEDPAGENPFISYGHNPSNMTNNFTANKSLPDEKITGGERPKSSHVITGLIRLQYLIGIYPYWKEMEGTIPTLLDVLRPYERKPVLEVPAIIVISCILWEMQSSKKEMLRGLDYSVEQLRLARSELFLILRTLAGKGATIVWMLLDPVRNELVRSDGRPLLEDPHPFSDQVAEWFNTVLAVMLLPLVEEGTVMLWDTGFPVSVRVNQDCATLMRASNETEQLSGGVLWKCYDFLHPGPQANQVNAQILLNYACNEQIKDVLQTSGQDYCCAGL